MPDPNAARARALELFGYMNELEEPESLLMPLLLDAISIVEVYRGARHQVSHLPELTRSIDKMLRELEIIERTNQWAADAQFAGDLKD